jgi:phage shock protein PspC (stress-responsive transcriptional regulator)
VNAFRLRIFGGIAVIYDLSKTLARAADGAVMAIHFGMALPVITRFFLGIVKMKATTEEAVILAEES